MGLCKTCSQPNFTEFFAISHHYLTRRLPLTFYPSSREARSCEICEFLDRCLQAPGVPGYMRNEPIHLINTHDFSSMGVVGEILPHSGKDFSYSLLFEQTRQWLGFLRSPEAPLLQPMVTAPLIDWNLVKGWLRSDVGGFEQNSLALQDAPADSRFFPRNMATLIVIDCKNRHLVQIGSGTDYVTLSYVWGSTTAVMGSDGGSLSVLPPTIEDSVRVCVELGYQYLWVDRYCISQNDSIERHRWINKMDTIYARSSLTIVACAGRDPEYGLPGVSTCRQQCPGVLISGLGHLQMIPHLKHIHDSRWASRAWTYQETLLSCKRLYFTDFQLYFEGSSSVDCEWATLYGNRAAREPAWIFSQRTWLRYPTDIFMCISAFTNRKLSYEKDALNAMMGIFTVFERRLQVRHLWGTPFSATPQNSRNGESDSALVSFQDSLLFFSPESSRRAEFPSWTWAGWTDWSYWSSSVHLASTTGSTCLSLELVSGRVISWDEYQQNYKSYQEPENEVSRFIHVHANFARISRFLENGQYGTSRIQLANKSVFEFTEGRAGPRLKDQIKHGIDEVSLMWFSPAQSTNPAGYLVIRNMGTH